jgi:SNF2 family DNA or RNA helicase
MAKINLQTIDRHVSGKIYTKGENYYNTNRVKGLHETTPGEWVAEVNGNTGQYEVEVSIEGDTATEWLCDCPYDGNICKHVVAVMLKIKDKIGATPPMQGATQQEKLLKAMEAMNKFKDTIANAPLSAAMSPEKEQKLRAEELMEHYDSRLSDVERRFLKIAAITWEPFSQTKIVELYNGIGFKYNGINLYPKDAKIILDMLLARGYLKRTEGAQMRCEERFADELCNLRFKEDQDFAKIVTVVRSRAYSYVGYWNTALAERHFRDMRIAKFQGDADAFAINYKSVASSSGYSREKVIHYWIGSFFNRQRLEALDKGIQAVLLDDILNRFVFDLQKPDDYYQYVQENITSFPENLRGPLITSLIQVYMFQGDWAAMEKNYKHLDSVNLGLFTAIHHFLTGNNTASSEVFNLTMKELRRVSRNPKAFLSNLAGFFQILMQLKTQNPALYIKIQESLNRIAKNPHRYSQLYVYLTGVLTFLQNNKNQAIKTMEAAPEYPLFKFFRFFCQYWIDEKLLNRLELKAFYGMTKTNGYDWMAAETLNLIDKLEPASAERTVELEAYKARFKHESLAELLPRIEDWENALTALMGISSAARNTGNAIKENDTRLIWLIDFQYKILQPKEQTYGKKGWTSGRNIALQRLRDGEIANMTDQDKRISKYIQGWGNYYDINWDGAIRDMVGHPLLFLSKSPDIAVQFLEEKPVLMVKQSGANFVLNFSHDISGEGVNIVKESPTRYKLIQVTADMARIARTLVGNKLLVVPEKGAERLKTVLQGLSGMVTVQSALEADNQDVPAVDPDNRTCIHLLPVGDGFHVELYAKPFTAHPPYLKPGEGETTVMALVEGEKKRTNRDLKAEKKNAKALRDAVEILRENKPSEGTWEIEDAEACLELLLQLEPLVQSQEIMLEWPKGEKFRITKVMSMDSFRMNVRQKGSWFEVDGELRVGEDLVYNMQQLLALSERSKGQFIELAPGQFLALTADFRRRLKEINGLMTPDKNGTMQLHPLAAPALQNFTSALQYFNADQHFKENAERFKKAFDKKFPLPKKFNAELRAYQQEGYEWLNRCAEGGVGACLADDMGLGKTVQALAMLVNRAATGPALVVAPASVCRNWIKETEKFAPTLNPILFGEGDRAAAVKGAKKGDLVVVTYDLMTRETELFEEKDWATIILDEAQAIKNRSTKRSETAMNLKGDFKMIMTGTPVENHLGELWNLFQFANPGLLGTINDFAERFIIPIEKMNDDSRRQQLRRLVQPFILRRRKNEVLKELPEKTEITLTVELSPEETAFYESLRRKAMDALVNSGKDGGEKHLMILAEITRLRRAACHPHLVDPNLGFTESSKLRLFGEIVEELIDNGHKALVFSQFVTHLSLLEKYLQKKGVKYQYLDGQTPLATRQKRIEAFQAGEGDLFLISLKAGGVGLNLTAADYVVHMDPWWNPAVEDQATDRAHRIGQEKPVTVYRLVAENTIEEKILKLHEQKRDLADSLLSGADMSAKLTADELLALIAER